MSLINIALTPRTLSNNRIERVEAGAFQYQSSSLKTLDISNNVLTHFPALTTMTGLRTVNLANNEIASLGAGAFDNALDNNIKKYKL